MCALRRYLALAYVIGFVLVALAAPMQEDGLRESDSYKAVFRVIP